MIKVFVVDDSAVVRQTMKHLIETGGDDLQLLGSAPNPIIAANAIQRQRPDVLLLDIEMPGMDGLTFLRQIMAKDPIPTVICSTLTAEGSRVALDALAAGAVTVIAKPRLGLRDFLEASRRELLQALRTAAASRPRAARGAARSGVPVRHPGRAGQAPAAAQADGTPATGRLAVNKPVVIGGSTGATQAVEQVLQGLPADGPALAIVLHMPEKFTAMYASRLDGVCPMQVREARDGDRLQRGLALVAPGGRHMQLRLRGGQYFVAVQDGPPVNRHKPSVDVLFRSAVATAGAQAMAVLLTGMGDDGARGLADLYAAGAQTIAQDEATCVVFGMPREAIERGAAREVLALERIADAIVRFDARA